MKLKNDIDFYFLARYPLVEVKMTKRKKYIDHIKANEERCKSDTQGLMDEFKNKIGEESYHSLENYTRKKREAFYHSDGWICASNIAHIRDDKRCKDCNAEIDRAEMRLHHITNDNYYDLYMNELETLCIPCHDKKRNSKNKVNGNNKGKYPFVDDNSEVTEPKPTTIKKEKVMANMSQEIRSYFEEEEEEEEGKAVLAAVLSNELTPCEAYDKYLYARFGEKRPDSPIGYYGAMHKVLQEKGYKRERKLANKKIAAKRSPAKKQVAKGQVTPNSQDEQAVWNEFQEWRLFRKFRGK